MRIKIASGKVYEGTPSEILARLHQTSEAHKKDTFRSYLEGFVERLRPVKVWLEVPDAIRRGGDAGYVNWLGQELLRTRRWSETTDPTEEEKAEKAAKAAAEAKAKAAAAAAAKPATPASAPATVATPPAAPKP
jgi:hypothetical protein